PKHESPTRYSRALLCDRESESGGESAPAPVRASIPQAPPKRALPQAQLSERPPPAAKARLARPAEASHDATRASPSRLLLQNLVRPRAGHPTRIPARWEEPWCEAPPWSFRSAEGSLCETPPTRGVARPISTRAIPR